MLYAQKKLPADTLKTKNKDSVSSGPFSGLKFRSIGPALMSGRIADIAVNAKNHSEYYLAVASGGICFAPVVA